MVISVRVYAEHPDIALAETIRSLPDVTIRVVSEAGTDPQNSVYLFWFEATDFDELEATLTADHTVADFSVILETANRRMYRIRYSDEAKLVTPAITGGSGITVESESQDDGWMLQFQLQDHEELYALREYAIEEGITLDIAEIRQTVETRDRSTYGLTDAQQDALVTAFVHGYFDEPRETSLEELASLLDISSTAMSGRLRRGSARLIEEVLLDDDQP